MIVLQNSASEGLDSTQTNTAFFLNYPLKDNQRFVLIKIF